MKCFRAFFVVLLLVSFASVLSADEGMWLFTGPPLKELKEKYNFEPTKEWLDHLRLSAVGFGGGSASFVSADGLVFTNHHVGIHAMHKLGKEQHNLLEAGFHAKTPAEELKCPDVDLKVLISIEDVTERVRSAVAPLSSSTGAAQRRREVINTIEKESFDKTGLKSEVVKLYHGGLYHLYRYKVYTDVRLVFAPEESIASFGGDPDNFEYPRYDLDICFFRAYEDGQPAKTPNFLKWNSAGPKEGELIFMAGNPARTERLKTVDHLEYIRDFEMPSILDQRRRLEIDLSAYSQRSAEHRCRAGVPLRWLQNSRKARLGMLAGLQDPKIMKIKRGEEEALRRAAAADPKLASELTAANSAIAGSLEAAKKFRDEYVLLEVGEAFHSSLFGFARTLVRMAEESGKPDAERLPGFQESKLDGFRRNLLADTPIYPDMEIVTLGCSMTMYMERMGYSDPLVRRVMGNSSPRQRAEELVRGTKLADVEFRRRMVEADAETILASDDPMIRLARLVDGPSRKIRALYESSVAEPQTHGYAMLAGVRFAAFGESVYPDATHTLRLSFGPVKGYDRDGESIPAFTTFAGLYKHGEENQFEPPYSLPKQWLQRRDRLNMDMPMNFVSTNDIIGGNSGSPAVNRDGEVIGIVFDGNLSSLVWDFVFTEKQGRAVSVHAGAIIESLRKIYDAGRLADELERGSM